MTSDSVYEALMELGFKYDCSAFPPELVSKGFRRGARSNLENAGPARYRPFFGGLIREGSVEAPKQPSLPLVAILHAVEVRLKGARNRSGLDPCAVGFPQVANLCKGAE